MTVGELRAALEGVRDDAEVRHWDDGIDFSVNVVSLTRNEEGVVTEVTFG